MFLLSFTFCRAQESYQEVVTDSAYSANFKDAKIIDSALIEGYVTNNKLTPKKFKNNFRKNYQKYLSTILLFFSSNYPNLWF
jgi:hypothetical protein